MQESVMNLIQVEGGVNRRVRLDAVDDIIVTSKELGRVGAPQLSHEIRRRRHDCKWVGHGRLESRHVDLGNI